MVRIGNRFLRVGHKNTRQKYKTKIQNKIPKTQHIQCFYSKGRVDIPNRMNFWKSAKGGGLFSIKYKIVISGIRVCFFQQLYCITIVLHVYLEIMCSACISYYPAIISPHLYTTISVIKIAIKFSKSEGGGEGRLELFRKFIRFDIFTLPSVTT